MELKSGYKQTEVGVIPEDWKVKTLQDVFTLKHGFAFSSEFFSKTGPIVLTPGNFRLEGGLYFEDRNTKRYSGSYTSNMTFSKGDLLIVMTDLTPDCNLLGKPAFVESDEIILHNQRIGKLLLKDKDVQPQLLFHLLLSRQYLDHLKAQATGSTVRHTSNKSIYSVQLAWPPTEAEQRAIAEALSDVDELLGGLNRLIAKKCDLKQATMQQLLTGQTRLPGFYGEWVTKRVAQFGEVVTGGTPRTDVNEFWGEGYPWVTPTDISSKRDMFESERNLTRKGLDAIRALPANTVLVTCIASIGKNAILKTKGGCNQQINALVPNKFNCAEFLYYLFEANKPYLISNAGMTATSIISKVAFLELEFKIPSLPEQNAIASVLSDMDTEIAVLEKRREKTRALKQAMMQELLTGKTRLVAAGASHA